MTIIKIRYSKNLVAYLAALFPLILLPLINVMAQNVGIGTTAPLARLHVTDSSVLFSGGALVSLPAPPPPVAGPGIRMMWYVSKAALRAGAVNGTAWDADSIGPYSFAAGFNSKALGSSAISLGNGSVARANYSTSMGAETQAIGEYSTSMGLFTTARGNASTSMGIATTAKGDAAAAIGYYTTARAFGAFSIGVYNDSADNPSPSTFSATDRLFQIGNGTFGNLNNAVTVLRNGNMGIGTTNPGTKLHVFNGNSGYNSSYFPGSIIEGSGNTYLDFLTPDGNESAVLFGKASDAASGGIVYNNSGNPNGLQFRANGNATRMVITNTGNIGIGTLTPNAPLQFSSTISNRMIVLYEAANNDHQFYGFGVNAGALRYQTPTATDDHIFYSGFNGSSSKELLRIKGSGNVGIGNSFPSYLLDVNGRMRIRSGGSSFNSAGIWLNNSANNEVAFIGMEDDTHVGLFGLDGAGWKFGMNTQTGALKINGSEGQSTQLLQSNGSSSAPSWVNPLNSLYNNMFEYAQTGTSTVGPLNNINLPGMSGISIVISTRSKVIFSSSVNLTSNTCFGCGGSTASLGVQVNFPGGSAQDGGSADGNLSSGESRDCVSGMKIFTLNPGTYIINVYLRNENLSGPSITASFGRLDIIIIQE